MSEKEHPWWLVSQLSPTHPGNKSDLEILRQVTPDEERQTRAANELLTRLAAATPYARLVQLFEELIAAFERDASPARRAADMNQAARALGAIARALPHDLHRHGESDFGTGSRELQELERAITEETERPPFRLLVAVGELKSGPFAAADDAIVNDEAAIATLASVLPGIAAGLDFIRTLRAGVVVAQRLVGRQLQLYEERVEAAALHIRRLAAEVADGAPALMRADSFSPDRGEINLGRTTFDPLALDKAVYLRRAQRHANELLRVTHEHTAEVREEGGEGATAPSPTAPMSEVTDDHARDTTTTQAADAEPPSGDRDDQVIDLRALVNHATAFTDDLEKAWSAALDRALLTAAQEELNARYASLLQSIQRRVAAGDRALRACGVDPQIRAYPLPTEEVDHLSLEPDRDRRWRQLQLAELDALTLLLEALEAMRQPSAQVICIDDGRVETWWEAGAFALVHARTRLLVRVSEQAALAEARVAETPKESSGPPAFLDRLELAGDALKHGDVEAAILHTRLALHLRAALEGHDVPVDLLSRLAGDLRLGTEAALVRLLEEAATRLAAGEALDVGAAVLIAPRALAVAGRLCLETPEIITDAIGRQV